MTTNEPDVLVRREGTEGLSMETYADVLRERLPEYTVVHATTPAAEREFGRTARVITGNDIDTSLLDSAENLSMFACTFAGTDHLPMSALDRRDVVVTNASGIHAPGIAEQVLGYVLVFARNIHVGMRRQRRREWRHFQSRELTDSTVTIVGLGAIGTATAERLEGFDVTTIGIRKTPSKGGPTDEVYGMETDSLHEALARTDYLVVAAPLTDETSGLVGTDELATLPPEAVVVNVARGPIVDTDALVDALQRNGIRGAALDVTDPEPLPSDHVLWTFENVIITPHTGGHTPKHWSRLADIVATNVRQLDDPNPEFENAILTAGNTAEITDG